MIKKYIFVLVAICYNLNIVFAQNWTVQNSGVYNSLKSVYFVDNMNGWAVGTYGTIIHTTNGGSTWAPQTPSTFTSTLYKVQFINNTTGWIASSQGILKTTDAGANWTIQYATNYDGVNVNQKVYSIAMANSNVGWAVGNNSLMLKTTNGGQTWTAISTFNFLDYDTEYIYDVFAVNADTLYTTGTDATDQPTLFTHDGGGTWDYMFVGLTCPLYSIFFTNGTNGWAVGKYVFNTTDGQYFYEFVLPNRKGYSQAVHFSDLNNGWIVGDSGCVYKTKDKGTTWNKIDVGQGANIAYNGVFFTNANTGWIVGNNGTILKTSNGGGITTGVIDNSDTYSLSIFPNPSNGMFKLTSLVKISSVEIVNSFGEIIQKEQVNASETLINLSQEPKGVYFFRIISDNSITTKKIIIE